MPQSSIDIIIPSYNGRRLLTKHLPQVIKHSSYLNKIIVVDNGSTDGTVDWLAEKYPEIQVVRNKTNLGFTIPINQGVAASRSEFFVLLNNDVRPGKDYLKNILSFFHDDKVFAVSFNEAESSWPQISWDGKIQFTRGEDKSSPRFSPWGSGGSAIFRRTIWDKIGGFNPIYSPYYWEDIDIGYRAWKMGYKVIWDNHSSVFHEHESTASKLNQTYVSEIKQRNELIFNWLNITDKDLVREHRRWLLRHTLTHPGYFKIVFLALIHFLLHKTKLKFTLTDREVLSNVNRPLGKVLDLSIILVTYKSEDTIVQLLDSLKRSVAGYSFEVIVVDNNSIDRSADLSEKHKLKPKVIRNKENLGFSKAVNRGLKEASGEYILLLNPDTLPVGLAIKRLLDFAKAHPDMGAVAPALLDLDGAVQPSCFRFPTIWNAIRRDFFGCKNCFGKYYPGKRTTQVDIAVFAAFLTPTQVMKRIGGLDERYFLYYEDIEYCRQLKKLNLPVYFYPAPKVKHIHGASGNFASHLQSPLLASSKVYYGPLYARLLHAALWFGHKWQVILRRRRFRD